MTFTKEQTKYIAKALDVEIGKRGMKKSVFYKKSGITSGAFSQWNTGRTCAKLTNVQKAADALNIPIGSILPEDCDLKTKNPTAQMDDEASEFARLIMALPPEKRAALKEFLQG